MKMIRSIKKTTLALLVGVAMLKSVSVQAATIVWTNTISGIWGAATNWNPNSVPGASDTAIITNAGVTVTLNGATTVAGIILGTNGVGPATLSLSGQTLTLNGPLTVNPSGSFTIDSGNLTGNSNAILNGSIGWTSGLLRGVLTVASNSTLTISTASNNHNFGSCTLTNNGTVNWSGDQLYAGGGTLVYNYGLWNAQDDQTWNNYYGGAGTVFNNYGTFRKSGGTNISQTLLNSGVVFNQLSGAVDVQTAANGLNLTLQGGGSFTGGSVTTNAGGLTYFSAGSFYLNGTVTSTNVIFNAGGMAAGNNVIRGGVTWQSGNWNNTSVTVSTNSLLVINTPSNNHLMGGCLFTNYGTVNWSGDQLYTGNGTFIYNYGLWNAQDDQILSDYYGGANTVFNNYGILRKSGGASELANDTVFANGVTMNQISGMIDVLNGTNGLQLNFQGGGNFTGGFVTTNASGLTVLGNGGFVLNGTVTGTNTWENNGNLVNTNFINGALTWQGGIWNNAEFVTINPGSTLIVSGGSAYGNGNNDLASTVVTNNGTVLWVNGTIRGGNSGVVYNYGVWNAQSDQTFNLGYGGAAETFNNYGIFRKSGGASELANATFFASGVVFNQLAGAIDVQNGTNGLQLNFQYGGNFTGGYITTNQFGLTVFSVGDFNLNGTVTGTNTWEDAGNLVGTCVINGNLTWIGGNWNNATSVTIPANSGVLAVGGPGNLDFNGTLVNNSGVFAWASGTLRGGNAGVVNNYGVWNAQSDQTFNQAFGGAAETFNNYGIFRKSGGGPEFTNNTVIASGVTFNQLAGVIDVQNSTNGLQLALGGGGNFTGGYVTTNTEGLLNLYSGNYIINGTVTGTNTWLNGAFLAGTNFIQGAMTWTAGNWNPSYFVTIATNSTLIVAGGSGNNMDFNGVVITNNGAVVWSSGTLRGGNGSTVYNNGLWDCQSDQIFNDAYGGSGTFFNNYGTLRKSGGGPEFTNNTIFQSIVFNQLAGVIDVQNSTNGLQLALGGGGNFTGGYVTTNTQGLLNLYSGNYIINGAVTGTNTWLNGADLAGTNFIQGAFTWTAGSWNPSYFVTIATNSTLIVAGGSGNNMDFNGVILTNNGTVFWSSGTLRGGNGSTVYNNGLWDCQSDQIFNDAYGGSGTFFNNYGTFVKTAGVNNGSGSQIQSGITFNNSGRLDAQAGVISLQGAYSLTNGTLNFGLNGLTNYGEIGLAGAAPLVGTVSANLNNGYIPVEGNSFTNLYYGSYTGGFTNAVLPFADAWTTNYFPTYFVITVLNSRPILSPLATNTFVVNELTTLNLTNTAVDLDVPTQTLVYSLAIGTNGMKVTGAPGVFSWSPQQTNSPSTNLVSVAVTDNGVPPLSASNTFTVIVKEVNVPPSLPTISTQIVSELTQLTVTNSATNSNIHSTITGYALVNPPTGMAISAGGVITWTPTQAQSPGTNLITTIVTNSNPYDLVNPQLTATNTFAVVVREVNVPPSLPLISTQIVNELTLLTVTNSATNSNIHSTISGYALVSPMAGMSISAAGVFTWTPTQAESPGTNLVTTIVTNSNPYDLVNPHLTSTNLFTVIVKEVNVRPSLPTLSTQIVNELTLLTVTNAATNANVHATITGYTLVSPLAGMSISAAGVFTWTPTQAESPGTNLVTTIVTNSDSFDLVNSSLTATNTFTIVVKEVNVPASLPTISTQIVNELTLLTLTNAATNANIHASITGYRLVSSLAGMSISAGGVFTWTPAQTESPGTNLVTTIVTNSDLFDLVNPALTSTNTFTVIVKEINQAPVLPLVSTQTVTLLQLFNLNNAATEPNIHSTNGGYLLASAPAGMTINSSGTISWTPAISQTLTTNTVTTVVTNGNPYDLVTPHLTATNSFVVIALPNLARTNVTLAILGKTNLSLSWPADHTGWRLEYQTNSLAVGLSTNWVAYPLSASTNQIVLPTTLPGAVFSRLVYP